MIEMKLRALSFAFVASLGLIAASGCSRADLLRSELEASASSAILSGNDQRGLVGSELPDPLVVRVLDAAGRPVAKQPVNFVVTQGGGSVYVGMAITDAKGLAREWWTLGATPGTNSIEVRALDRISSRPLILGRFYATAFSHLATE